MKAFILSLCLFFCFFNAYTQAPPWAWGHDAGGTDNDEGCAICTDRQGYSYVCGTFAAVAQFGTQYDTTAAGPDIFLARYDTHGTCLWVRRAGSIDATQNEGGYGVGVDAAGNCYMTGYFYTQADFGPYTLSCTSANRQIFVAKYDTSGNVLWAVQPTSFMANNYSRAIAVDAVGNSFITGYLGGGTNVFGHDTLNGPGAFVIKYDASGNEVFATHLAKFGGIDAYGIALDAQDNSFIAGYLQGTDSINGIAFTSSGDRDEFLIKVDATGHFQWLKHTRSILGTTAYGNAVAVDRKGNPVVTGYFDDVIQCGSTTLTVNHPGSTETFIIKYDTAGNYLWAKQTHTMQTGGRTEAYGICTDDQNNIAIAGTYLGDSIVLSGQSLPGSGTAAYVALLDSAGNCKWLAGSTGPNVGAWAYGVSTDNNGGYYITGLDKGAPEFGGYHNLVFHGMEDLFVAKIGQAACTGSAVTINIDNNTICASDSAQICAPQGVSNYHWSNGATTPCIYTNLAGNYHLTATDNGGCSVTSNAISLNVLPSPPISISVLGDTFRCYNDMAIQWLLNGQPIPNATDSVYIATGPGSYSVLVTDSNGCKASSNPYIVTGIGNIIENAPLIGVFPNPFTESATINLTGAQLDCELHVFDVLGKEVSKQRSTDNKFYITKTNVSAGLYMFEIRHNSLLVGKGKLIAE